MKITKDLNCHVVRVTLLSRHKSHPTSRSAVDRVNESITSLTFSRMRAEG